MDLREYQKHARRTLNADLGPHSQLANMALGITGEFGELASLHDDMVLPTQEQVKDEGGDVMWYIANTCNVLSLSLDDLMPESVAAPGDTSTLFSEALVYIGGFADVVKKTVAQGHVLDIESVILYLQQILGVLNDLFVYYGLSAKEVCEYNHLKLMKRYPNGFSAKDSVNRGN